MPGEQFDAPLQNRPSGNRQQLLGLIGAQPLSAAAGGNDCGDMHGVNL